MSDYGQRLRDARIAAGMTQDDVASHLGKTRAWVTKVEAGAGTTTDSLEEWAALFGLEMRLAPVNAPVDAPTLGGPRYDVRTESDLADMLREVRLAAGLSRAEISELVGMTTSGISNIERGHKATTTRLLLAWVAACASHIEVVPDEGPPVAVPPRWDPLVARIAAMSPQLTGAERTLIEQHLSLIERARR